MLNVFKPDEEFLKNEKNYETIKKEILGKTWVCLQNITQFTGESDDDDSDSSSSSSSSDSDSSDEDDGTDAMIDAAKKTADGIGETVIIDHTEAGFQNDS